MKKAVLGTGAVGQTIGAKLVKLGHDVVIGKRNVEETMARAEPGLYGQAPFSEWLRQHPGVLLGSYAQAAQHGVIVINATNEVGSLDALRQAGEANLKGKISKWKQ